MSNVHHIEPHISRIISAARAVDQEARKKTGHHKDSKEAYKALSEPQRKLHNAIQAHDRALSIGVLSFA